MKLVIDPELKRVTEEAMKLSTKARASLAASLLRSLDGPEEPGAREAWRKEIARRMRETDEGRSQPIPWAIARQEIFGP